MNPIGLGDSVWLHFGTSSASTGAATDADSTPAVTIAEDGSDIAYSPTVTNVATGLYKVQINATAGNGFEAGKRYSVYVTATVGGVTGRDGIGEFEVLATDLNTGVASVVAGVAVASVAANAIDAAALAADAITEIQNGLSTLNAAGVRAAVGLTSADLDLQLAALAAYVDTLETLTAAVKAQTDQLAFTAGLVQADVQRVRGQDLTGTGTEGDPWGPA